MTFTDDQRGKLESMLAMKAISASEKSAIRAALARIDELEEKSEPIEMSEQRSYGKWCGQ